MRWMHSISLMIAPEERFDEDVLPVTILLRPIPMLSLMVMVMNDHYFKGANILPSWVTGILSDFTGLVFFPILLMTMMNLVFYFVETKFGFVTRFSSPRRGQILFFCLLTGAVFAGVQTIDGVTELYSTSMAYMQFWNDAQGVNVVQDPWDLLALSSLVVAYKLTGAGIRQLPPGRLRYLKFCLLQHARTGFGSDAPDPGQIGLADVYRMLSKEEGDLLTELVKGVRLEMDSKRMNSLLLKIRSRESMNEP